MGTIWFTIGWSDVWCTIGWSHVLLLVGRYVEHASCWELLHNPRYKAEFVCVPVRLQCSILEKLRDELQAADQGALTHDNLTQPGLFSVHPAPRSMLTSGLAAPQPEIGRLQHTGGLPVTMELGSAQGGITSAAARSTVKQPSPDTVLNQPSSAHTATMYSISSRSSAGSMHQEHSMPFSHGAKTAMSIGSSDEDVTVNCKKGEPRGKMGGNLIHQFLQMLV